jgi:hypothetical protein
LAIFWPWGAPFFRVAPFWEWTFAGATVGPCSATAAAGSVFLVSVLVMFVLRTFLRLLAHDDSSLWWPSNARRI